MNQSDIKEARESLGLKQRECAAICRVALRTWQAWEYGTRTMPAAAWELFNLKTKVRAED